MTLLVVCYADFRSIPPGGKKIARVRPLKNDFCVELGAVTPQESFAAPIDRNYTPKHRAWVDLKKSVLWSPPLF